MKQNNRNKGFSLVELLITLGIMSVVGTSFFGAFKYFSVTTKKNIFNTKVLQRAEKSLTYLTKDIIWGMGIAEPVPVSLSGLCFNTDSTVLIAVPSVDENLAIIEDDGVGTPPTEVFLGGYLDYIYLSKVGDELRVETIVAANFPAAYTSGRTDGTLVVADNVQSLTFSNGTTNLLALVVPGPIPDLRELHISVTIQETPAFGKVVSKTLKTKVHFRNHP